MLRGAGGAPVCIFGFVPASDHVMSDRTEPMRDYERRIAELRQEIDRLRVISHMPMNRAAWRRIRVYLNVCVKEYIRLVERRPQT
jgi:hypothetical protein